MSRIFTDRSMLTWEAYPSGGPFGLPDNPKIVFHCISDPELRARYVEHEGDDADAGRTVRELNDGQLQELLAASTELE